MSLCFLMPSVLSIIALFASVNHSIHFMYAVGERAEPLGYVDFGFQADRFHVVVVGEFFSGFFVKVVVVLLFFL